MNRPGFHVFQSASFRLGRLRDGLASIPDLGHVYVQARGPGGGLGNTLPRLEPMFVDGLESAFDPDAGLGFSVRDLEAIHAHAPAAGMAFEGSLDFEFAGFPQGVGIHLLPDPTGSRRLPLGSLIESVPATGIDPGQLADWRRERRPTVAMCPCCRERAAFRARHPQLHPLHAILRHAIAHGVEFECRLHADHVDFSARFAPAQLEVRDGFLIVTGAAAAQALHVNMARLHAMAIDRVRLDGCDYADLRLFDPRGINTLRILCEDAALALLWRDLCTAGSSPEIS
jgi:hypothetical protein